MVASLSLSSEPEPVLTPSQPSLAEVVVVGRIELRGFRSDFNMPANRHATSPEEVQGLPGTIPLPKGRRSEIGARRFCEDQPQMGGSGPNVGPAGENLRDFPLIERLSRPIR